MTRTDEAVNVILPALRTIFGDLLHSVVVKGSAIKDDFVPFYSDLDVHAYLRRPAMLSDETPRHDLALAFRDAIGHLDPGAFQFAAFQIIFVSEGFRADWAPPVPGTYRIIHGDPTEIYGPTDTGRYLHHARRRLDQLPQEVESLIRTIVDKPDTALVRVVRLAGSYLKGQVYNAAAVISGDPLMIWRLGVSEIWPVLEPVDSASARGFFTAIQKWPDARGEISYLRARLREGLQAMVDLSGWWEANRSS